jgi:hypothetical protein
MPAWRLARPRIVTLLSHDREIKSIHRESPAAGSHAAVCLALQHENDAMQRYVHCSAARSDSVPAN